MLSAALNSHPNVICQTESLNSYKGLAKADQIQIARNCIKGELESDDRVSIPDSASARGLTLNPYKHGFDKSDLKKLFAGLLPNGSHPPRLVLLTRRNKLKQAVSICRAEQFHWKSNRLQFSSESDLPAKGPLDVNRLEKIVSGLEFQTRQLVEWSAELSDNCCAIEYEWLNQDSKSAILRVFQFVGINETPSNFDFQAGYQKILPDRLSDSVENYDQLKSSAILAKYLEG